MISHPDLLQRVLVPLDGSPIAEAVLPEARRILRRPDSEIILVRADLPLVAYPGAAPGNTLEMAKAYLAWVAEGLEEQGVRARMVADVGPAFQAILKAARDEKATLIAMSTHGRTGATRAVLGSVAEQVVRRSPVPVLVVRTLLAGAGSRVPPDERHPFRNVLLPLDRSERSLGALGPAADFCRLFGARLLLLHILESEEDRATSEAYLQAVEARASSQGVAVTSLVETGRVADEILDVARFHDVDLIAMATHGRRGLARLVTGSVTEEILRKALVPVLVVRTTAAAALEGRESVA